MAWIAGLLSAAGREEHCMATDNTEDQVSHTDDGPPGDAEGGHRHSGIVAEQRRLAAIAARADQQDAWAIAGDPRGTYGVDFTRLDGGRLMDC